MTTDTAKKRQPVADRRTLERPPWISRKDWDAGVAAWETTYDDGR